MIAWVLKAVVLRGLGVCRELLNLIVAKSPYTISIALQRKVELRMDYRLLTLGRNMGTLSLFV